MGTLQKKKETPAFRSFITTNTLPFVNGVCFAKKMDEHTIVPGDNRIFTFFVSYIFPSGF